MGLKNQFPETEVQVVHLRKWKLGKKLKDTYYFQGVDVISVSIPQLPYDQFLFIRYLNIFIVRFLALLVLRNTLKNQDIYHTVGLELGGVLGGFWASKYNTRHIAQGIGADVNLILPRLMKYPGIKSWLRHTDFVIFNSKALEDSFKTFCPGYTKTSVCYRGISVVDFPFIPAAQGTTKKFLFLGGVIKNNYKGHQTLMNVWNEIDKMDLNCILFFGGPNSNSRAIRNWKNSLKNPEKVFIIGSLSSDKVKEYIAGSHYVIVPSLFEGLPNIAMEAMATGRPVIGSNTGGIPELIMHNYNGFLFNKMDEAELKAILINTLTLSNYEQLSNNCRAFIQDRFDSTHYPVRINNKYTSLIT